MLFHGSMQNHGPAKAFCLTTRVLIFHFEQILWLGSSNQFDSQALPNHCQIMFNLIIHQSWPAWRLARKGPNKVRT